jgi:hypothetical protein
MGRYGLGQLSVFVLACGVYFGGIPHMYFLGLHARGAEDVVAFTIEAVVAWVLLAGVYVYWRQVTPLAVHCLCVVLGVLLLIGNPDIVGKATFAWEILGRASCAGALISFPVSLLLLALSAVLGRRVEPLTNRFFPSHELIPNQEVD